VVHDAFEIWAAVAIDDFSGEIVGWRNPPDKLRTEIENAIKKAFDIPFQYLASLVDFNTKGLLCLKYERKEGLLCPKVLTQ